MKKLIWRIRFMFYGEGKTAWGWRLWWEWSETAADDYYDDKYGFSCHEYAANEYIYDAMW